MTNFYTVIVSLFLILCTGYAWSGDYQKGLKAYKSADYFTALQEWTPLAEQGQMKVQYELGLMYMNGLGVPTDYEAALKWYTLSAKQGFANSQSNLGLMYESGQGVPQNFKIVLFVSHMFNN